MLRPQWPRLVPCRIRRAPGEQHRYRNSLDALGQVGQEPQRVMVGPLAIVHQYEHRGLIGDVHHQPVQAVQRLEANISAQRLPLLGLEQPGRGTGSACEQVGVPRAPC